MQGHMCIGLPLARQCLVGPHVTIQSGQDKGPGASLCDPRAPAAGYCWPRQQAIIRLLSASSNWETLTACIHSCLLRLLRHGRAQPLVMAGTVVFMHDVAHLRGRHMQTAYLRLGWGRIFRLGQVQDYVEGGVAHDHAIQQRFPRTEGYLRAQMAETEQYHVLGSHDHRLTCACAQYLPHATGEAVRINLTSTPGFARRCSGNRPTLMQQVRFSSKAYSGQHTWLPKMCVR